MPTPQVPTTDVPTTDVPTNPAECIAWLRRLNIDEVECIVPDMNGMMRGKIVPREDFIRAFSSTGLRLPEHVLIQGVTGDSVYDTKVAAEIDQDIRAVPDVRTIRVVPWYGLPTAQVICDCAFTDGTPVDYAPRSVLRAVLDAYRARGLKPIIAPEIEFYLVAKSTDHDLPLAAPPGQSGRAESGRQAYGIEAANEFDPVVEAIYSFAEASRIEIGTMAHESGPAQLEMNFRHGDPMELADQAFLFKRTARQAAMRHGMFATFMAQPHVNEPGSAMHIHQSVVRTEGGANIFVEPDGADSPALLHYVSGLQRHVPTAMPLFCPNVNSYRRIRLESDAPINVHWGRDNRTCGLRVPDAPPEARRIENRVVGADANPYLATAATLACGLIGLEEAREPAPMVTIDAHTLPFALPRHLHDALSLFEAAEPLRRVLGGRFVDAFTEVKRFEWQLYNRVISSWEREYLLLNV